MITEVASTSERAKGILYELERQVRLKEDQKSRRRTEKKLVSVEIWTVDEGIVETRNRVPSKRFLG